VKRKPTETNYDTAVQKGYDDDDPKETGCEGVDWIHLTH
jgi:hypothetical protein